MIIVLLIMPSSVFAFGGPLQVKNELPIFLHANMPYLEGAEMEDSLSLSLSHSSTYIVQESWRWTVNLDMEITTLNIKYKKIIHGLEVDVDLPLLLLGGGFMDGFLNTYHSTFGFGDYGRPDRPLNSFLYEIKKDGIKIVEGKEGIGVGDIRFGLKKTLYSGKGINIGIRGGIELPAGDPDKGFGNGSLDADMALLINKSISDRVMTYINIGGVYTGDLIASERLNLKDFLYAGIGVETILKNKLGFIIQFEGHRSIYPETGLSAVDTCACLLSFGGRYYLKKDIIDFSLTEDISLGSAPDFIFNITYKMRV